MQVVSQQRILGLCKQKDSKRKRFQDRDITKFLTWINGISHPSILSLKIKIKKCWSISVWVSLCQVYLFSFMENFWWNHQRFSVWFRVVWLIVLHFCNIARNSLKSTVSFLFNYWNRSLMPCDHVILLNNLLLRSVMPLWPTRFIVIHQLSFSILVNHHDSSWFLN